MIKASGEKIIRYQTFCSAWRFRLNSLPRLTASDNFLFWLWCRKSNRGNVFKTILEPTLPFKYVKITLYEALRVEKWLLSENQQETGGVQGSQEKKSTIQTWEFNITRMRRGELDKTMSTNPKKFEQKVKTSPSCPGTNSKRTRENVKNTQIPCPRPIVL